MLFCNKELERYKEYGHIFALKLPREALNSHLSTSVTLLHGVFRKPHAS
jgi:hypothetical protein